MVSRPALPATPAAALVAATLALLLAGCGGGQPRPWSEAWYHERHEREVNQVLHPPQENPREVALRREWQEIGNRSWRENERRMAQAAAATAERDAREQEAGARAWQEVEQRTARYADAIAERDARERGEHARRTAALAANPPR
jgi:hypothetical protein